MANAPDLSDAFAAQMDEFLEGDAKKKAEMREKDKETTADFIIGDEETEGVDKDGKIPFSALFGWTPQHGDFGVTVFDKKDWAKSAQEDIPKLDEHYVWDRPALELFARAMEKGHKPRLVGSPGVGKSTMPMNYCAMVNRPFGRINFNHSIEPSDIIGQYTLSEKNGSTVTEWVDGDLPNKMRAGYVLLLDEMYRAPSGVLMALQRVFEQDGILKINEKHTDNVVVPHTQFRIAVADNTKGLGDNVDKFGSAMIQDVSSLNRFEVTIEMDYLSDVEEIKLLQSWHPKIQTKLATQMVQLANKVRDGYNSGLISLPLSPRNMKAWGDYTVDYNNPIEAFRSVYYNSLADEAEKLAVKKMANELVFNTKLWGEL